MDTRGRKKRWTEGDKLEIIDKYNKATTTKERLQLAVDLKIGLPTLRVYISTWKVELEDETPHEIAASSRHTVTIDSGDPADDCPF